MSWRARRPGLTLVEVLLSAGLLLFMSALLFSAIIPAIQRGGWFSQKHDSQRGFLIARERLTRKLRMIQLSQDPLPTAADGTVLLQYYRPAEVETSEGWSLSNFTLEEALTFDLSQVWELYLQNNGHLWIRNSADPSSGELIWRLGEGATASCTPGPELRSLDLEFGLDQTSRFSTKSRKSYRLVISIQ